MLENYTSIEKANVSTGADLPLSRNLIIDVPVFVASDRKTLNDSPEQGVLAPMQLGYATVSVPDQNNWHTETQAALRPDLLQLGWQAEESARSLDPPKINIRGYTTGKDYVELKSKQTDDNFWPQLTNEVRSSKEHNVYVYIHGFGESARNSIYASGVLASQLEAPVIDFSWPSSGNIGSVFVPLGKHSTAHLYRADRKTIDNPQVSGDLARLLAELKQQLAPDTKINLVAHSLGNRLLAHYLEADRQQKFHSIYFLAADLSKQEFLRAAPSIAQKAEQVEVFMNPRDKVLGASALNSLLEFHSPMKLGKANISAEGIQFFDYGPIAQPKQIGHYLPFNQFASIIKTGKLSPSDSSSSHWYLDTTTKIKATASRSEERS